MSDIIADLAMAFVISIFVLSLPVLCGCTIHSLYQIYFKKNDLVIPIETAISQQQPSDNMPTTLSSFNNYRPTNITCANTEPSNDIVKHDPICYYNQGVKASKSAQQVLDAAFKSVYGDGYLSSDINYIQDTFLPTAVIGVRENMTIERCDLTTWVFLYLKHHPCMNMFIGNGLYLWKWISYKLPISRLEEMNNNTQAWIADPDYKCMELEHQEQLVDEFYDELIRRINPRTSYKRLERIFTRLNKYITRHQLVPPANSMLSLRTLSLMAGNILIRIPLPLENQKRVNLVLDKIEAAIRRVEQNGDIKTWDAYITHFSDLVEKLLLEVNAILQLLRDVCTFFETIGKQVQEINSSTNLLFPPMCAKLELLDLSVESEVNFQRGSKYFGCYERIFPLWLTYVGLIEGTLENHERSTD
ncbi:hypothetical protein NEHOM01_2426 [Nematocida homosporus]|uniref:uncharacterized protein n=1 Tax=Nematocida homosporus TaxID=1912981 RepID=UPI00221FCC81|nr:uncharacterized protein NEHOM01_2426 [Nematocida homosporus]KAI5187882.1 hypothetical protein NEHOM01_2426 [Nematocida homosporus]